MTINEVEALLDSVSDQSRKVYMQCVTGLLPIVGIFNGLIIRGFNSNGLTVNELRRTFSLEEDKNQQIFINNDESESDQMDIGSRLRFM